MISRSHRADDPGDDRDRLELIGVDQHLGRAPQARSMAPSRAPQVVRHDRQHLVLGLASGLLGLAPRGDVDERQHAAGLVAVIGLQDQAVDEHLDLGGGHGHGQADVAAAGMPGHEHPGDELDNPGLPHRG